MFQEPSTQFALGLLDNFKGVKTFSPRAKNDTLKPIEGDRFFPFHNGSLQIISAKKDDSGNYMCAASNMEGKSTVTAVLDVKGISAK